MNLVLLGSPGSGKGTQAKFLEEKYSLPHISTGDIFRRAVEEKSAFSSEIEKVMKNGGLVPDDIVVGVVKERLARKDCAKGFILDGFPRTLNQAKALDSRIDIVFYIELDEEEVVRRLSARRVCVGCGATYHTIFQPPAREGVCSRCSGPLHQREDDSESVIRKRMNAYNSATLPLVDYYSEKGILERIDGKKSILEINAVLGRRISGTGR